MICLKTYSLTRGQIDLCLPLLQQVFIRGKVSAHVLLNDTLPMRIKLYSVPPADFNRTLAQLLWGMFL